MFKNLVQISLHGESKLLDICVLQSFRNFDSPLITEGEPNITFVPYPPAFPVPIWVSAYDNVDVRKYKNQIPNPYSQSTPTFHELDPMGETLEWFMKPKVNANPLISPDRIDTHNSSLKSYLNSYHPISSLFHDTLPLYLVYLPIPNIKSDQVQGNHSSPVEEKESEDYFDLYSIFKNPPCQ